MIRNALATAVKDLLKDSMWCSKCLRSYADEFTVLNRKSEELKTQMKLLKSYLGISEAPDAQRNAAEGSCKWIDARNDFRDWRDVTNPDQEVINEETPTNTQKVSIFWAHAVPGSGKTFLASYVQSQLEHAQLQCAHYYFHVGNQTSHSLAPFLRSIAYKMAQENPAIREKLYKMYQDASIFDMDDAWTVWTKMFKKGILQVKSHRKRKARISANTSDRLNWMDRNIGLLMR